MRELFGVPRPGWQSRFRPEGSGAFGGMRALNRIADYYFLTALGG